MRSRWGAGMNCREFEARWNELLDARPAGVPELERALEAHASSCERCRTVSVRYQALRQAVSALRPPPGPSPASMERLYALTVPPVSPATLRKPPRPRARDWATPASAAAVFALAWLGGIGQSGRNLPERPGPNPWPPVVAGRPLRLALAEATEATVALARAASAPASRIGREMLDFGKHSADGPTLATGPGGDPAARLEPASTAPGVLRAVGDRVTAGVKPISGSARHAFSFLLRPLEPGPVPPEARGSL